MLHAAVQNQCCSSISGSSNHSIRTFIASYVIVEMLLHHPQPARQYVNSCFLELILGNKHGHFGNVPTQLLSFFQLGHLYFSF